MNSENLESFLNKKTELPKIIIIYGPTSCGKTTLSIDIAAKLGTEIIGADSRQIYKLLDIGTGKIKEIEKKGIIHHMIDILDINKEYSVGEYKKDVEKLILEMHNKGKIPIICGGTGLYLDSIAFNFDIPEIIADWTYRGELEKIRLTEGNEFLWKMLADIDREYANELEINNYRYVMRGLEIFKQTGKSKKELKKKLPPKYDVLFINPYDGNREILYSNINKRIDEMFDNGLLEEVKSILLKGYTKKDFGLNSIGYKEIIDYLEGNISFEICKELIKQHNRNYAKRQLTWFRRYENN